MMRRGTDSMRTDSPNLYYPIYVDPETKTIKEIGKSIPIGQNRAEVYCIHKNGHFSFPKFPISDTHFYVHPRFSDTDNLSNTLFYGHFFCSLKHRYDIICYWR